MQKPDFPANEEQRQQALRDLEILDTPPEERFDRLTRLAQSIFKTPIALVSLVDTNRQWFKSKQGLDAGETPRDISFCGHAILGDKVFYIPDASADQRFADNPLVTQAPNIRFYAGAPVSSPEGFPLGTLCVIDSEPHKHTQEELQVLRDLADCVEQEFKQIRMNEVAQTIGEQGSYLHSVLETVVDGIMTIDERGIVQTMNKAAEQIFGYSATEVIGQNVKMLMPEHYAREHDGYVKNYVGSGHAKIIGIGREVEGQRKDGSRFPMELAVSEMSQRGQKNFVGIVRDISARKEADRQLIESKERFELAVRGTSDGLWDWNIATNGVWYAPRFRELLGYGEDEFPDGFDSFESHLHPEDHEATMTAVEKHITERVHYDVEYRLRTKSGPYRWFRARGQAIWGDEEKPLRMAGSISDITERKQAERIKSEFVSTVSHELRTPLTSIKGALGLVLGKLSDQLPDKGRQLLETADRNCERLTLLINDLLDLEKIESGGLEFEYKMLDLVGLTRNAVMANEGYAQQHGVKLRIMEHPNQAKVWGDEHRLLQVFANLVSNAVKYSPKEGEVEVAIHEHDGSFRVSVKDHGRGIPEAFRDRIFQRFAQADSSDTREKGGTGLGLSITRAIVEHHRGQIDYITEEGVGTEFYFELPEWQEVIEATDNPLLGAPVLICEDNPDVAFVLSQLLEHEGMVSDIASTADGARALLGNKTYRALLLDLGLPDCDGLSFICELREAESTRELPVIVVSGRAEEGRKAWSGDSLAVADWLQKPVDRERMRCALQQALRPNGHRPRILHVEDEHDIIQITQALTEELGDYSYATNLQDARRLLAEEDFDLTILDVTLPDGSGLDLLEEIKGNGQVMVFSGQEPDGELSLKVAAALTKSKTSNEQLLATIKQVINRD